MFHGQLGLEILATSNPRHVPTTYSYVAIVFAARAFRRERLEESVCGGTTPTLQRSISEDWQPSLLLQPTTTPS